MNEYLKNLNNEELLHGAQSLKGVETESGVEGHDKTNPAGQSPNIFGTEVTPITTDTEG